MQKKQVAGDRRQKERRRETGERRRETEKKETGNGRRTVRSLGAGEPESRGGKEKKRRE